MDVDSDPATWLAKMQSNPNLPHELKPFFELFSRYYEQRLWFQLTATIEQFLSQPQSAPFQVELYQHFVNDFANKLNQLKLVSIGITVSRQFSDGNEALAFLTALQEKVKGAAKDQQAYVLATMSVSHFKLLLGDAEGAKAGIDECSKILDLIDSVDLSVHAAYYSVSGDYHKAKAEYAEYYKNSLLYLACVDVDKELSLDDRIARAHDLGIAALLGKIYNFGELLLHPVLESLKQSHFDWIRELLFAFNAGDIPKFDSLSSVLKKEPILEENYSFLRQKICLMALIESVFKRPSTDRVLPFSIIASETRVSIDEVEHLVMKALSLKLIQGTIDQVSSNVAITWVQPRVLDKKQLDNLRTRLVEWSDRVRGIGDFARGLQAPQVAASS